MSLSHQVYECVHCSRSAFTGFCGKVDAEESFWVFESFFRIVMSPKPSTFEGHPLFWVNCRCGQELGYFIPRNTPEGDQYLFNKYLARVGRIKVRADVGLTERVEYEGRILHWFQLLKHNRPIVDGHNEDVLFEEILPRLPIESLMRFRGVCKKWRHCITTDSRFISNHLRRSSQSTKMSIILATNHSRRTMLFVDHHGNKAEVADVSMVLKKCGHYLLSKCKLVGCCDGLVCLRLRPCHKAVFWNDVILLWNPETGQSRDVKEPPSYYLGIPPNEYPVYGLGFDQSRNDYKVVKLRSCRMGIILSVFSMNTGRWELEKGVLGCELGYESVKSVLVRTRLYWLVVLANVSPQRLCVLWFDLNNDEFGTMDVLNFPYHKVYELPPHSLVKWNSDYLAFLQLPNDSRKEFQIQFILHPDIAHNISLPRIPLPPFEFLGVSWDQFFIKDTDGNLIMYDFETGVGRRQQLFSSKKNCVTSDVRDYVPSLVSVYPDLTNTRQDT